VCLRTSSSVNRPWLLIALTMSPLQTPLQPQTSASSGIEAALGRRLVADVADMVLAEHQVVAHLVDVLAVLDQLEIPGAVGRVAVEHGADQGVVLHHQLLVHAAGGSLSTISSVPAPPMKLPAENRSMPVTLSLVEVTEPV
jgi:hypothetical protein